MIRPAKQSEHEELLAIARQYPETRDFSHMMFSGPVAYEKGWIRVYEERGTGLLCGFTCVRHKVREPETSLYYIAVRQERLGAGIGQALMDDLVDQSPHRRIALNVTKNNSRAIAFYNAYGFRIAGESLNGKGLKLVFEWEEQDE